MAPLLVQVCVRPGTGVLTSKFLSIEDTSATLNDLYYTNVLGTLNEREDALAGALVAIKIKVGDVEADPMSIYDQLSTYTDLPGGLQKVIFIVSQGAAAHTSEARTSKTPAEMLVREPSNQLPTFKDSGHPATQELFSKAREELAKDGCGFRDVGFGKRWMLDFVKKVLYPISTFHLKLSRDHSSHMPGKFAFSEGANDYQKKKQLAPLMKHDNIIAARDAAATLALSSFLFAGGVWAPWKTALDELVDILSKAAANIKQRAQAQNTRDHTLGGRNASFFANPEKGRLEYRSRVQSCSVKYANLSLALSAMAPYTPLSTTSFEPPFSAERFYWLQNIQLDADFVTIRANVGGSIGTLVWVARRAEGMSENDDRADVLTAQNLTKKLIPLFHSRAMQNRLYKATSGVSKLGAAFASALYRDLTGDESAPKSKDNAARLAFAERVIQSVGADGDAVIDLRKLANAARLGDTMFEAFWLATEGQLDSMVLGAEERRHSGVVAYLSEIISHKTLYTKVLASFNSKKEAGTIAAKEEAPSLRWFEMQFCPANEYIKSASAYTGRFQLKLQLQTRQQRKDHGHFHYCRVQNHHGKAFTLKFRPYVLAVQADDKANGTIGEPGTATSFLARQRPVTAAIGSGSDSIDHDVGNSKTKISPTVMLVHDPPHSKDGTWYRGKVFVSLKDTTYEPAEANRACSELEGLYKLLRTRGQEKTVMWIHADGGPEHNVTFPTVQASLICLFLRNRENMHTLIHTRGCPHNSWVHEVERIMSIVNLALYGVALERPLIDQKKFPGMENLFRKCKSTTELRAAGKRNPELPIALLEAMAPVNNFLLDRFEQLSLKEVPFERGPDVSEADADEFYSALQTLAPTLSRERRSIKRGDFNKSGPLNDFFATHCVVDPYKFEVRKQCWFGQLEILQRNNNGDLPEEEVQHLYKTFKCPFGCPPPSTPPFDFLAMCRELPRPQKNGAGHYKPFDESFGQSTPPEIPELNPGAKKEIAAPTVLQKEKLRRVIKCIGCAKPRGLYVEANPERSRVKDVLVSVILPDVVESNKGTFLCSEDLNLEEFPHLQGKNRPYVRVTLTCTSSLELQIFSSGILGEKEKTTCGYCGEEGELLPMENEATHLLPVCDGCKLQFLSPRSSGRQNVKFDKGNRRAKATIAATSRSAQVAAAKAAVSKESAAPKISAQGDSLVKRAADSNSAQLVVQQTKQKRSKKGVSGYVEGLSSAEDGDDDDDECEGEDENNNDDDEDEDGDTNMRTAKKIDSMGDAPEEASKMMEAAYPAECVALLSKAEYLQSSEPKVDAALIGLSVVLLDDGTWKRAIVTAVPNPRGSRRSQPEVDLRVTVDVGQSKQRQKFMLEELQGQPSSEKFTWALVRTKAAGEQRCFFADTKKCMTPFVDATAHKCKCGHAMHNLCTIKLQESHFEEPKYGEFFCPECIPTQL